MTNSVSINQVKYGILRYFIALFLRAFLLLTPVILLFYTENRLNYKHLLLFQGFFYLTSVIAEIPIGYMSDKFSRRNIIITSFLIYIFVILLWLNFNGFWIILVGEILFGISKVMMDNTTSGYLYDYLTEYNISNKMQKLYSFVSFFLALGTAFSCIAGASIYAYFSSKILLTTQLILILIAVFLIMSMPNLHNKAKTYQNKISQFPSIINELYNNKDFKYYIFLSGTLTASSILFAVGFQPILLQKAFPIFIFGIITFINHGIRALSCVLSGTIFKTVHIDSLIIPLYILYVLAFCLFLSIFYIQNKITILIFLVIICCIIGVQLIFTIMHITRLHNFVNPNYRGCLMSINNIFSRSLTAIILICSKILFDNSTQTNFYFVSFLLYIIFTAYIVFRIKFKTEL